MSSAPPQTMGRRTQAGPVQRRQDAEAVERGRRQQRPQAHRQPRPQPLAAGGAQRQQREQRAACRGDQRDATRPRWPGARRGRQAARRTGTARGCSSPVRNLGAATERAHVRDLNGRPRSTTTAATTIGPGRLRAGAGRERRVRCDQPARVASRRRPATSRKSIVVDALVPRERLELRQHARARGSTALSSGTAWRRCARVGR